MRTPESITKLLYDLYTGHEWEEMEEYFLVAEQLILLHGGHFRIISDVLPTLPCFTDFGDRCDSYNDSEEAWREEINRNDPFDYSNFKSLTNTFIYFNK